jgi:GTPase Era involved in 16S rRNA processing
MQITIAEFKERQRPAIHHTHGLNGHVSFCMQIIIAEFKERQRPAKDYIHAQILVERDSQVQ